MKMCFQASIKISGRHEFFFVFVGSRRFALGNSPYVCLRIKEQIFYKRFYYGGVGREVGCEVGMHFSNTVFIYSLECVKNYILSISIIEVKFSETVFRKNAILLVTRL